MSIKIVNFINNVLFFILSPLIFPLHFIYSLIVSSDFRRMFLGAENIYNKTFYGDQD